MALERIGFFSVEGQYGVLSTFAYHLADAFSKMGGIQTSIINTQTAPQIIFEQMKSFRPQLIIVFNSLFKTQGKLLCDFLNTPTLFYLVDAPFHFDDPNSPFASTGCIDRTHCRSLLDKGFERTYFLPHSIDEAHHQKPESPRPLGCVMLSSGIDYEKIYDSFHKALPSWVNDEIDLAIDTFDSNPTLPLEETLTPDLPTGLNRKQLLRLMDLYLKGKKRVELLQNLNGIPIDLFGGGDSWKDILRDACPHVTIHPEVNISKANDIMSQAKVILNSCSSIKDGGHERIFSALSYGAAVVTKSTPYLYDSFGENAGIAFCSSGNFKDKLQQLLTDEKQRKVEVERGQECLVKAHLWKHRAQEIYALFSN